MYREKNVELLNALDGKSLGHMSEIRSGLFAAAISHSEQWIALGSGNYGPGGDLSLWSLEGLHEKSLHLRWPISAHGPGVFYQRF